MPLPTTNYAQLDDSQLDSLIQQLSQGVTRNDVANGYGGPPNMGGGKISPMLRGNNRALYAVPLLGQAALGLNAYKTGAKKKAQKKEQEAANRAYEAALDQAYAAQQSEQNEAINRAQGEKGVRNRIRDVNFAFSDEAMGSTYAGIEKNALENSMNQLQDQYGEITRQTQFQTAEQGLVGGSVDAERRADVQQGQEAAAANAAVQARGLSDRARQSNDMKRRQLIQTVSDPNPYAGVGLESRLSGIRDQTGRMVEDYTRQMAGESERSALSGYGQQMQSQAVGGFLSGVGSLYRTDQTARGRGNRGLY